MVNRLNTINNIVHSSNLTTHKSSSDHDDRYYTESEIDTKLSNKATKYSSKGSATQPIYIDSNGIPTPTTYTLSKSVPSNAIFTDTNTWRNIQDNLTSTSTTDSLSANQGRLLNNNIKAAFKTNKFTDNSNWALNSGCYTTNTGTSNLPVQNTYGILLVFNSSIDDDTNSSSWIIQFWMSTGDFKLWTRKNINWTQTNWTSWKAISFS